ncbi:hypothetical protein DWB84_18990 [Saccharophagus sp. K07]|uniref:hypothetical protein n=1 Tax=Saccharophagus sp. K07 TaxID=2283636 RepID=UPI0016521339|nr:hypothetical protein [Saccharophagus sp. K07]MBC6907525.1 hypothetical protein [Saccharophagus sp. K07]
MRNYFKYPPLEWRKREDYCVPQGPSFAWAPWTTLHLAGNRLRFKAPRHSPHFSSVEQNRVLPGHDVLADSKLRHFNSNDIPNDHWGFSAPLSRTWAFWGPWMTGCKAELHMDITVLGRQPGHAFDFSFFHPRAFEMVLVQYLNDSYGHEHRGGNKSHIPRFHGPVDWQRHSHLPTFSASCKVYKRTEDLSVLLQPDHLFFFPITDRHFVQVTFVQHLYSLDERGKFTFDPTPVQALQDAIFNSISLELSPKSQASYNKVKAEVGDMQLTPTFAPLKWPIGVEESTAQQDSLFIER